MKAKTVIQYKLIKFENAQVNIIVCLHIIFMNGSIISFHFIYFLIASFQKVNEYSNLYSYQQVNI